MSTTTNNLTADQLFLISGDGIRRELIQGEVRMMSPTGFEHGDVLAELTLRLRTFVKQHQLGRVVGGDVGFLLSRSPDTVRAPDVAFVRQSRIDEHGAPKAFFPGPPDLAVEVVSPHDAATEVDDKAQDWLAAGASEVWVVNPAPRSVRVYWASRRMQTLTGQEILQSPELLPGFKCIVAEIFS